MIAIIVPALARPGRVAPLVASIKASGKVIAMEPIFVCSPSDTEEIEAVKFAGVEPLVTTWEPGKADYARKCNLAIATTTMPFVFLGGDDIHFHPGWAERAIATWYETGACVIGTNDLGNNRTFNGQHSTHTLIDRDYLECGTIDESGKLLHEGYDHNFVDNELIETAKARNTYAHAADSHVEHLHPNWRKGSDDGTYRKGMAHWEEDRLYFKQREHLWKGAR